MGRGGWEDILESAQLPPVISIRSLAQFASQRQAVHPHSAPARVGPAQKSFIWAIGHGLGSWPKWIQSPTIDLEATYHYMCCLHLPGRMAALEEGRELGSSLWGAQLSCASVSFQPYCHLTGVLHVSWTDPVEEARKLGPFPLCDATDALIQTLVQRSAECRGGQCTQETLCNQPFLKCIQQTHPRLILCARLQPTVKSANH